MTIADSRVVAHRWLRNGKYTFTGWVGGVPSNFSLSAQNQCVETHGATWTVEYAVPLHLLAEAESQLAHFRKVYVERKQQLIDLTKERDALQSRLDAVGKLADRWDAEEAKDYGHDGGQSALDGSTCAAELRAALGCATTGEQP